MKNLGLRLWRSQDNETLATPDYESTRQLVLRQPLVVSWTRSLRSDSEAQNITTLQHYILRTTDNSQRTTDGRSRNYGTMELRKLNFALLRQTTRQRVNETTSSAAATCSLVVLWTSSLRSNSEAQVKQKKLFPLLAYIKIFSVFCRIAECIIVIVIYLTYNKKQQIYTSHIYNIKD